MNRPVVVTKIRGWIYCALIALAGRRLLWPVVIGLAIVFVWVTWPLVPVIIGILLLTVVAVAVLAFLLDSL